MKRGFLIILITISNLLVGQGRTQIPNGYGSVRFVFFDTTKRERIKLHECYITYGDGIKDTLYSDIEPSPMDVQPYVWIYAKPGMYKFLIQTKEYKDIIVKDVKVIKEKTDFIAIYE